MDRHDVELLMTPDTYAADLVAAFRRRPSWHSDAACAEPQYDVSLFFPARGERADEAKRVCAGCLVRDECEAFADADWAAARYGVWAGLSGRERREARRARSTAA